MRNSIIFIILFSLFFMGSAGGAGLTPEEEERLKQLEAGANVGKSISQSVLDFKKSFSKESIGRFQAIKLSNDAIFIIDTKEGHIWIWVSKGDRHLIYEGQVFPGTKMGDIIESWLRKK